MTLLLVLKNVYKMFENILFEKWCDKCFSSLEKSCKQAIKISLHIQGCSYSFPSHLEIVLSIPLFSRSPYLFDVKGEAKDHWTVIKGNM